MLIGVQEPRAYLRQWSGRRPSQLYQELSLSSGLECQLLEYRNLTLRPLVRPFTLRGQAAVTQGAQQRLLDGSVFVEPVFATVSQHMVHTVDTAIKGWQQVSLETHTHTHTHTHILCLRHKYIRTLTGSPLRFNPPARHLVSLFRELLFTVSSQLLAWCTSRNL